MAAISFELAEKRVRSIKEFGFTQKMLVGEAADLRVTTGFRSQYHALLEFLIEDRTVSRLVQAINHNLGGPQGVPENEDVRRIMFVGQLFADLEADEDLARECQEKAAIGGIQNEPVIVECIIGVALFEVWNIRRGVRRLPAQC